MGNPSGAEKGIYFFILAAPITLHSKNLAVEQMLNKTLKFMKKLEYFRFMTKQIDPREFTIIINKTHIISFIAKGINGRTPHM
jgi:hypothetical protein